MPSSIQRILIPLVIIGMIVVVGIVFLLSQQATTPACGAHVATAGSPVALDSGASVALAAGSGELRFDSAALTDADLTGEANAEALAAVNAMPVNLRTEGPILTFTRCNEEPAAVHLESPSPGASLDAYAWDGVQWTWLAGATDSLSVDLPDLPKVLAWAETLPTAPVIGTESDPDTGSLSPEYNSIITELYAPAWKISADGSVDGPAFTLPSSGSPYLMYRTISNVTKDGQSGVTALEAILTDAASRKAHIDKLVSLITHSDFAGLAIDYRGLTAQWRNPYAAFVEELAANLHANGRQLVVMLAIPDASRDTAGYDWRRIGRAADVVQIDLPVEVAAYQPGGEVDSAINWATSQVNRLKIQPSITAASVHKADGSTSLISFVDAVSALGGTSTTIFSTTIGTSMTFSLSPSKTLTFEAVTGVYSGGSVEVHTAATLAWKLNALPASRVRGVLIRYLHDLTAPSRVLEPIKAYRQQSAITGSSELSVDWTITAADGSLVLSESQPLASSDVVWTPASDGTYTVTATIGPVRREVARVTVGQGDAATDTTPTPEAPCLNAAYVADVTVPDNTRFDKGKDFVKTWKVRNNGTCAWSVDTELAFVRGAQLGASGTVKVGALEAGKSVDVSVPMKSGDKDGALTGIWRLRNQDGAFGDELSVVVKVGAEVVAPPPVAPLAGGGPTQYGIHSHYYGYIDTAAGAQSIVNYTNELGLGWTKIQFRWGDYDYYCGGPDLNQLDTMISTANAAGQKVMLSVVTAPPCTHPWTGDVHAPPDDPAAFAELVGGLADLFKGRIHAIEVWNEQNISREWLTSPQKLDAARYTQLLAAAYNAIKAKDPNILVISGALAPTGWNDGVNATDDFEYLKQMVAAGATKVMDCVGVHVNALRVPPSASLGGPYDSLFSPPHHSWYFKDTVLGYLSITGKPACVTEFGVASPETIGQVEGFEWANENTQQEQADWVTEGMSLCKQWGCRLVILWNLDYGPATRLVNDNALYSFIDIGLGRRPVFHAVQSWCAANGCR